MADLSDYSAQRITDWVTGNANMPATTTRYAGLYNGDPQSGGTEVTTTIRAAGRVAITPDMASSDSSGNAANDGVIDFGNADAGATITHIGISDASSAGNLISSDSLAAGTQVVTAGNAVNIPVGDLTFASS